MLGILTVSSCLRKTCLSSPEITLSGIVAFFIPSACSEKAAFVEFVLARSSNGAHKCMLIILNKQKNSGIVCAYMTRISGRQRQEQRRQHTSIRPKLREGRDMTTPRKCLTPPFPPQIVVYLHTSEGLYLVHHRIVTSSQHLVPNFDWSSVVSNNKISREIFKPIRRAWLPAFP